MSHSEFGLVSIFLKKLKTSVKTVSQHLTHSPKLAPNTTNPSWRGPKTPKPKSQQKLQPKSTEKITQKPTKTSQSGQAKP